MFLTNEGALLAVGLVVLVCAFLAVWSLCRSESRPSNVSVTGHTARPRMISTIHRQSDHESLVR